MKNKKHGGTLFALLARHYLAFTLALLAIAFGLYELWSWRLGTYFSGADVTGMFSADALLDERYASLRAPRYLGTGGAFAVYDGGGALLYRSDGDFAALTAGELGCIPEYGSDSYYDVLEFTDRSGARFYRILRAAYDGGTAEEAMVLDSALRVVSGGLSAGKTAYTQRELDYLLGRASEQESFYRYDFTARSGAQRTLLLRIPVLTEENYSRLLRSADRLWLLALPLYLAAAGGFILWLDKRIRRPLDRLGHAIVGLGEGRPARAADCGGPREIRRLGENFDAMARKLDESEQERRALDESRQTLIADISHDLRTPITVISGYTSAIRDGKVPPAELPRYLEAIDNKAQALSGLIDTFYEYSRTEHPDFRLARVETDLCEFLREYLAEKYDEIDLAGFELQVEIPETPFPCLLDGFQFRRALDNILSNALRHNRLGTVIRFEVRTQPARASILIADNGEGIPAALRAHVFEPFRTGDESRPAGGSGLGLTIAKRIVELHGGSIRLLDPPRAQTGTTFEIILPAR